MSQEEENRQNLPVALCLKDFHCSGKYKLRTFYCILFSACFFFFFFPSTCFEWILLFKIYFFLGVSLHFNSFYSFTMFAFASLPRDIIPFPWVSQCLLKIYHTIITSALIFYKHWKWNKIGGNVSKVPLNINGAIRNKTLNLDCHWTTWCLRIKWQSKYIKAGNILDHYSDMVKRRHFWCCSLPRFFLPLWRKDLERDTALSRKYLTVLRWEKTYWAFLDWTESQVSFSWEMCVQSLGWEDPLEEGMATNPGILAWRVPWTEEVGRQQFIESQRVRHSWSNLAHIHTRNTESSLYSLSLNFLSWISIASVVQKN